MSDEPKKQPRRRNRLFPQTARELLEPLITPLVKKRGFGEVRILTHWAEIVGPKLAAQSRPMSIQGQQGERSLLVAVNPAFATDLHYQQPQILERIATYCGARVVTRIQVLQQPIGKAAEPTATKASMPALPPLGSAKPRNAAVEPASETKGESDSLNAALAALANALQERKKMP